MVEQKGTIVFEEVKPIENVEFSTVELEKVEPNKEIYRLPKTKLTPKQKKARAKSKRAKQARKINRKK